MKKVNLILSTLMLAFITNATFAQIINPGFETWSNDLLVPSAMNPNTGNDTYGWWDYNYFNNSMIGSSPISVTRCTDTVHSGSYSVRLETKVYTPTSWNIYRYWGIPFIGHEYNDTLGILFNGKVNVTNQTFRPGIPCSQKLAQLKFFYQYHPNSNDTAECRVLLLNNGTSVAGGVFKTGLSTGSTGWQEATIDFTYINGLTPDTLYVLFSSSSLDNIPKASSVLWIDDVSVVLPTGIEQALENENNIEIFPNPSTGIFYVKQLKADNQPTTIEIYNELGENIFQSTINNPIISIDISSKPKGIYFYQIKENENTISTGKITIQ